MIKNNNFILIIDDDLELCEEIQEILTDTGYEVDIANRGIEGLKKYHEKIYKLIILDLKMPDINGLEVLKQIKKNNKSVKVIIITARTKLNIEVTEISKNKKEDNILKLADRILQKPFKIKNLLSIIDNYLR